jgi:hypothetical protein
MNPDYHDPKNYVPPAAPGDNWEDLDQMSETPQIGIQPRRPDRRIPTKRDLNAVSAKRHAQTPKLCEEEQTPPIEPIPVGAKHAPEAANNTAKKVSKKAENKAAKTGTKRSAKKRDPDVFESEMDDAPNHQIETTESLPKHILEVVPDADEKEIPLPVQVERGSKRFKVNEITPQRPAENRVRKTPLTISKTTGKWSSNGTFMQKTGTQHEELLSSNVKNVRATLIWIISAGAVVIFIVVGAILLSRPAKPESESPKLTIFSDTKTDKPEKGEIKAKESLDMLIDGDDQAKMIFAKYATAKELDDFIDIIYLPDKNRKLISDVWEPLGMASGWEPGDNSTWLVMETGGARYGVLTGVLANSMNFRAVLRQDGDAMKIDWRATTGYSSANYAELKHGKGDAMEIRAILSPGDFHTFSLPEGEFRCYRLTSPDRGENIWAYTKLNSAYDAKLVSQFIPSQLTGEAPREIPVVMVLARGPSQSLPNQWIVSNVVRLNWLDE